MRIYYGLTGPQLFAELNEGQGTINIRTEKEVLLVLTLASAENLSSDLKYQSKLGREEASR